MVRGGIRDRVIARLQRLRRCQGRVKTKGMKGTGHHGVNEVTLKK